MREGLGDAPRATRGSVGRWLQVALTQLPPGLQWHRLQYYAQRHRKFMNCGTMTKSLCGCERAFCGISKGVTCWAWHGPEVKTG
jgi:hypothetical protein